MKATLTPILFAAALAACGCNKQQAKQAGNDAQSAAQTAGAVIDRGMNKLGAAANHGIRRGNEAAIDAKPYVRSAATQAAHGVGTAALTAGHLANRAGEKIHGTLTPATQPSP